MVRHPLSSLCSVAITLLLLPGSQALAQDLILNNQTITLGGVHTYSTVSLTNSHIIVPAYDGSDKVNTGNLQIRANTITIDGSSSITADGKGYQPVLCDNGPGPTATAGGRGGCAVLDSGGGGAHFGMGGRGTKDCDCVNPQNTCQFPAEFEENCGYRQGTSCVAIGGAPGGVCPGATGTCFTYDGLPTVAGQSYWHSIYVPEFGAAGGDKGCRDGWQSCVVAGAGGGRIVLAAVNGGWNGTLTINGTVTAAGKRGCGRGNDSGGGGAGGTVLLVGDQVNVGSAAAVSAAGGLGGDTNAKQAGSGCPSCSQDPGGVCDDCGGGGGGGIISVLSRYPALLASTSVFNVSGAEGGTCVICKGEAGGGAGELQLSGVYTGEFCDGHDNDFDGLVDEGLGSQSCGAGACQSTVPVCTANLPNDCIPGSIPSCQDPLGDTRPRFMVIADSSGSMLTDLNGNYTFGDGSVGHLGINTNTDGIAGNDSRLYKAKSALTNVISAYPEIDFALARYAQGVGPSVNCQLAHWFECAGLCCTYDDPTNNTGTNPTGPCTITKVGAHAPINVVAPTAFTEECINYAGSCGSVRRGADILVGFEKPVGQTLMWLDNKETNFQSSTTEGDHCSYASNGDCELRGTGPTPLADSLYAVKAYLSKVKALDSIASCRKYAVILLTDGTETCQGNPVTAAQTLYAQGVQTYVVGFSVLASEQASLNQIASAGGTGTAYIATNETQLAAALASIIAQSIVFEVCNGVDDDCDGECDESWPEVAVTGASCTNQHAAQTCSAGLGICKNTGIYVCKADGSGSQCNAVPGPPNPGGEICYNGLDDDCDGAIDEGCLPCAAQQEVCDGKDNDCDTVVDEDYVPVPCGSDIGECKKGTTACVGGKVVCNGEAPPSVELCDNKDNNCDTIIDMFAEACYPPGSGNGCDTASGTCQGVCQIGSRLCTNGSWGQCFGFQGPNSEVCNNMDDDCDGQIDEGVLFTCTDYTTCTTYTTCTACPQAPVELCDGLDNDCNGQIDDNPLYVGDPCGKPVGECTKGTYVCEKGKLICQGGKGPEPEICDGLDNDCNGSIDDNVPGEGDPCGTDVGECKGGKKKCIGGKFVCVGGVGPSKEICDGKDNDCDGKADDMAECPGGSACVEGKCLLPCKQGEFSCPGGSKCVNGYCISDKCSQVTCSDTQRCIDGQCVEKCSGISCANYEKCDPKTGQCVDDSCVSKGCPSGKSCVDHKCVDNPCPPDKCPKGQMCIDGKCYDTCANVDCPKGEVCVQGVCTTDPCVGMPCPSNHTCQVVNGKGECVPDPCRLISCGQGQICRGGNCIADPCKTTDCPQGFECKVDHAGRADCQLVQGGGAPTTSQLLASGSGGCACNTGTDGGGGPMTLLLFLAAFVVIRKVRR